MKSLSQALLVTLVATATSFGQTEAKTKPVGYESITLNANQFNVIGLRLQGATVASGTLETIGTSSVTDIEGSFATILSASKTYILEITSGSKSGLTVEATWSSGNNLNTVDNLKDNAGLVGGESYNLRPALTLEEVFGTTSSVLTKSISPTNADIVWVPDGVGGYVQYFLNNSSQWRRITAPAGASPNVPLIYTDGVFIEKKGASATLTLSGEVKVTASTIPVVKGFNVLSTIYPAGTTLQNFGLDDDIQKAISPTNADIVWVPDGAGGYVQYFLNNSSQWRRITAPAGAVTSDVTLPAGVLLERKAAGTILLDLTPPSAYSGL